MLIFFKKYWARIFGILLVLLFFVSFQGFAQIKKKDRGKLPKEDKKPIYIYKFSTKGIGYNNPCVDRITRKWGFEYELVCKNSPNPQPKAWMFFHNMWAKLKVTLFHAGPFWQLRIKKKIRDCRVNTGDFKG